MLDNKSGRNWGFWERSGQKAQWSPVLLSSICAIFVSRRTRSNPDVSKISGDVRRFMGILSESCGRFSEIYELCMREWISKTVLTQMVVGEFYGRLSEKKQSKKCKREVQ